MDAAEWDERYRESHRHWPVTPNLFVSDRLRHTTPGRGLDLGAGEGRNAIWLASLGWEMTAVDFSSVAIEKGAAESDSVEFVVADVREWEPEERYDLILVAYIHLQPPDFEKLVRRAREWLEPDGELFLIGHDTSNLDEGWGGPQYPEVLWDVGAILGWLDGLSIVEAEVVRRPVETDEGRRYARDTLVRARLGALSV
ncbi:MAG TPA: class I SAM-dependent methyltransferase [Acidimicrobiia bacterium]|jgi:SAM-dependent methyltransferase